jgi:hypothetical protein
VHFNNIIVNMNEAIDELPVESDENFTRGQRIVMQILAEPQFCLQRRGNEHCSSNGRISVFNFCSARMGSPT